jgi:hypothetical protein
MQSLPNELTRDFFCKKILRDCVKGYQGLTHSARDVYIGLCKGLS